MSSPFSAAPTGGTDVNMEGLTPVAEFRSKHAAHAAVEYLVSQGVTVRGVTLVGEGVRVIEQVMGPIPYGRVALRGAMSGGWMGLFVGILLSVTSNPSPVSWTGAMLIGVAIGMLVAVVTFALGNRKKRAMAISHHIVPERYVMCCPADELNAIRGSLAEFDDVPMRMIGGHGAAVSHTPPAKVEIHGGQSPQHGHAAPVHDGSQGHEHPHAGVPQAAGDATGNKVPADGTAGQTPQGAPDVVSGLTYGEALELKRRKEREQQSQGH